MTIKEIIDRERWTKATIDNCRLTPFNWRYLHNFSLTRVKKQISAHIAELEAQVPKVVKPEPRDAGRHDGLPETYWLCSCGCYDIYPGLAYCHNCGSKLNWEDA